MAGVEIVDPSELTQHHHVWLQWLGLQEPPPEADSWVAVVRGLTIDQPGSSSKVGARLVDALDTAGIFSAQRLYEFYDVVPGGYIPQTGMVSYVAVVVHDRDLTRARQIAVDLQAKLTTEPSELHNASGLSDAELTRLAEEAGPPPPD
jgi:hypothetical protein